MSGIQTLTKIFLQYIDILLFSPIFLKFCQQNSNDLVKQAGPSLTFKFGAYTVHPNSHLGGLHVQYGIEQKQRIVLPVLWFFPPYPPLIKA